MRHEFVVSATTSNDQGKQRYLELAGTISVPFMLQLLHQSDRRAALPHNTHGALIIRRASSIGWPRSPPPSLARLSLALSNILSGIGFGASQSTKRPQSR
jgi:hypothetical protein